MVIHFKLSRDAGVCRDQVLSPEEVIVSIQVSEEDIHRIKDKDALVTMCRVKLGDNLGCENEDIRVIGIEE